MEDFHKELMRHVAEAAVLSKDDVKVGVVLYNPETQALITADYNHFARGVNDNVPERYQSPLNKLFMVHAETNAIFQAVRHGIKLEGMGIALAWYPCAPCASAIVQAGIKEVICTTPDWDSPKWGLSHQTAHIIFQEAGVREIR
jgi:dCMP deaminase